jgi:3-methyl-2-oxobutanoate hydroxymethyltransferase
MALGGVIQPSGGHKVYQPMMAKRDKVTTKTFLQFKASGEKITLLTAYDWLTARLLDDCGIDGILVGDSANMVFYGQPTTLSITMDQMIYHTKAVAQAATRALVIGDMPFMSYQVDNQEAMRNAGRFLKEGGVQGVKLEGGKEIAPTVRRLVEMGIPVMGHIGLLPQSVHRFGGYRVIGRGDEEAGYLLESATMLQDAGCFSLVLEKIPSDLAKRISQELKIPTIGIGAGPFCDGQVLVVQDMLGLFEEFKPRFVRRYAELAPQMRKAFHRYIEDVKNGSFPSPRESY